MGEAILIHLACLLRSPRSEEVVMMLADRTEEGRDLSESNHDNAGTTIRDLEIAQIAVFKLRECAARLETLAGVGQESPLCHELRDIGSQLKEMEVALLRHARGTE